MVWQISISPQWDDIESMKKIAAFALMAPLLLALSACVKDGGDAKPQPTPSNSTGVIIEPPTLPTPSLAAPTSPYTPGVGPSPTPPQ